MVLSFFTPRAFLFTVNYRGSAGFGQDMVESLCGRAGDQDVKDVQVSSVPHRPTMLFCCYFLSSFVLGERFFLCIT